MTKQRKTIKHKTLWASRQRKGLPTRDMARSQRLAGTNGCKFKDPRAHSLWTWLVCKCRKSQFKKKCYVVWRNGALLRSLFFAVRSCWLLSFQNHFKCRTDHFLDIIFLNTSVANMVVVLGALLGIHWMSTDVHAHPSFISLGRCVNVLFGSEGVDEPTSRQDLGSFSVQDCWPKKRPNRVFQSDKRKNGKCASANCSSWQGFDKTK